MTQKQFSVGILGATGMVGQNYLRLLENHPWFQVSYLAASPRSAGKTYAEAVDGRWQMNTAIPNDLCSLIVGDANEASQAEGKCDFVFSALELSNKDDVRALEDSYAAIGIPVVSNASAHRHSSMVPMLIPEINPDHCEIIPHQQSKNGWDKGFVAVKPNCSLQSYLTPLYALIKAGYPIEEVMVTTMQAVSGAGYPGVPSLDMIDNLVPYIGGEEEKTEQEPMKILGDFSPEGFTPFQGIKISAQCNRVPVINGHTACVSIKFGEKKPTQDEILSIWEDFKGTPQELDLPFAPEQAIRYLQEANRPQPRKDRDTDKGMSVSLGRLRPCPVFDFKFVGLSHNTVRGAAGGGILNAELLVAKNYIQ